MNPEARSKRHAEPENAPVISTTYAGSNRLYVRTADRAGNRSPLAEYEFTVDRSG